MTKIFAGSVVFLVGCVVVTPSLSTTAIAGSGGSTGKISFQDIHIQRKSNSAPPSLYNGPPTEKRKTNDRIK
jgi:hypothetical protein